MVVWYHSMVDIYSMVREQLYRFYGSEKNILRIDCMIVSYRFYDIRIDCMIVCENNWFIVWYLWKFTIFGMNKLEL